VEQTNRGSTLVDDLFAVLRSGPGLAAVVTVSLVLTFVTWWLVRRELLRLPSDFLHSGTGPRRTGAARFRRNAAGIAIALVGVLLLVLPGPGILLIVVGLLTVELPGRDKFVRWLLRRRWALREVNAWRARRGEPPLHP
jgi:ABC-type Fe3+ transport system permease subunit